MFDVLTQLVINRERCVTKEELFDAVWGGRFVGEAALTSRIKAARRALGDDGESQRFIRTVRGRGPSSSARPPFRRLQGMYTADFDGVRASWVVRPDGTATGVQFNGGISGRDFEQAELQQLNELQFRNSVRNKRQLQQAQQITLLANKSARSTINGHEVTPVIVDGDFRL